MGIFTGRISGLHVLAVQVRQPQVEDDGLKVRLSKPSHRCISNDLHPDG